MIVNNVKLNSRVSGRKFTCLRVSKKLLMILLALTTLALKKLEKIGELKFKPKHHYQKTLRNY